MRFLITLGILVISLQSVGQSFFSGYIVKNNGDSINVLVKELTPSHRFKKCIVKEAGRTTRYSPQDLSSFGFFGGNRYKTLETAKEKYFAKVLVDGQLSLYQINSTYYVKEKELLLLPNNKKDGNSYIDILNSIIRDCNLTANNIDYSSIAISSIVQNYNRCTDEAGKTYTQKLPRAILHYSIKLGYSKNSLTAISKTEFESTSISNSMPINIGIEFSLPRLIKKLFLTSDLVFEKNQYQFYDESIRYSTATRRDAILTLTSIKFPLGLKYTMNAVNNTPYVGVGISPTLFLNENQEVIKEQESGMVVTTAFTNGRASVSQAGYWFSIGYTHSLYRKASLIVEGRYESVKGSIGSDLNFNTSGNSLSLTLGIRY